MSDTLLRLYHRLPAPARSVAASLRGLYLRSWRYGPESERLVSEALERELWSPERYKAWQEERLAYILHRAATRVPYYREQWAARRRQGNRASWEYLENWPVLEKESLRQNPTAFVADDCAREKMFHEHTSGTTGKPLDLWWGRKTVRAWYALFEARCRHWYGLTRKDRWAMLGGQLITPRSQRRPPFWVWNAALKQLYMSSYHLAPDLIPYYFDALKRYRVTYVFGYTSSLYALAHEVLQAGRKDLKMIVAVTNAEPVFNYQRAAIAEAFQCPVRETYGMAEIVAGASECAEGELHLWPEVGWLDVLSDAEDAPLPPGHSGRLISTSLLNTDMPLIRYAVGDRGQMPSTQTTCKCGRMLPVIKGIEGRTNDILMTRDGRRVSWLNPIFYGLPVREVQIIQETPDQVRMRYVPAAGFTPAVARSIVQRVQERLGIVEVLLEPVDEVPRERNGKFRAVICKVPAESGSICKCQTGEQSTRPRLQSDL
jgi:phenylacetate-CoA ligase